MRLPLFILYPLWIWQNHIRQAEAFTAATCHHRLVDASPSPFRSSFARFVRAVKPKDSKSGRPPSTVTDPDGPSPEPEPLVLSEVDPNTVEGLYEVFDPNELPRPFPHQPWRRGDTDGCHDPILAPWRLKAEEVIYNAGAFVADGRPLIADVTWFLTTVLVTLNQTVIDEMMGDPFLTAGPEIAVKLPRAPVYKDPNIADLPDIYLPDDEVLYQRTTPEEERRKRSLRDLSFLNKTLEDDPNEPHNLDDLDPQLNIPLYMNEETRVQEAHNRNVFRAKWERERPQEMSEQMRVVTARVNKRKISTIAQAILDGLETVEEECQILSRHELVLSEMREPIYLVTQKQFNLHRNKKVFVFTHDPWGSNRVLKGTLLDRNAMDLFIRKEGSMVTIPLNFVLTVRLAGLAVHPDTGELIPEKFVDPETGELYADVYTDPETGELTSGFVDPETGEPDPEIGELTSDTVTP